MVSLQDVQGRIYCFKNKSKLLDLGIPIPALPEIVRGNMVLVLGFAPGKKDYVNIMTITSKLKEDGDYVPIFPTPKESYSIQLRLRNQVGWYYQDAVLHITTLPRFSYLKIDSYYEVPIQMLEEAQDYFGNPLMIWVKHQGGLEELRDHVRHRDHIREEERLCQLMMKQSLEEDTVFDG